MFSDVLRGRQQARHHSVWIVQGLAALASASLLLIGCSGKGATTPTTSESGGKGGKKGFRGDVPVLVAKAAARAVPVEVQVIGNVEAYSTIALKAQIGGELTNVYFREGDFVKKGDLLFAIDQRPLQAAENQAEANHARDIAQLGQAKANLARDTAQAKYVEAQANRYAKLFESGIISKDQAEQLRANADATAQAVAADKAAIGSAEAA